MADRKCLNIGDLDRFGVKKELKCIDLPPAKIHKRIRYWMCGNCAIELLDNKLDIKITNIEGDRLNENR